MHIHTNQTPAITATLLERMQPSCIVNDETFTLDSMTVKHGPIPYIRDRFDVSCESNRHLPQIKSLLAEAMFLLNYVKTSSRRKVVIYAGAAQGHHLILLSMMFPGLLFRCYDVTPFHPDLEAVENIELINCLYDDDVARRDAEMYAGFDLYFISDIRDTSYVGSGDRYTTDFESDKIILKNHEKQTSWARILQPVAAMTTFRCPRVMSNVMSYMAGALVFVPYAKPYAYELRCMSTSEEVAADKEYNAFIIRQECHRHNHYTRQCIIYRETLSLWDDTFKEYVISRYKTRTGKSCRDVIDRYFEN